MREVDNKKTSFQSRSSGMHELTHMSFVLFNSGSNFYHENVSSRQHFVTILLYLDYILVFAASIDEMLDHIELVFKKMRECNLKIKSKKCHFFQCSIVLHGYVISADGISTKPNKVEKSKELASANQSNGTTLFLG